MGEVIFTIGCPRAGKTTYAQEMTEGCGFAKLSLDDIRVAIWGSKSAFWKIYDAGGTDRDDAMGTLDTIYRHAFDRLTAVDGKLIVANTHLHHGERDFVKACERGHNVRLCVFDIDIERLVARNLRSSADDKVGNEYLLKCFNDFQKPTAWWRKYPEAHDWRRG